MYLGPETRLKPMSSSLSPLSLPFASRGRVVVSTCPGPRRGLVMAREVVMVVAILFAGCFVQVVYKIY